MIQICPDPLAIDTLQGEVPGAAGVRVAEERAAAREVTTKVGEVRKPVLTMPLMSAAREVMTSNARMPRTFIRMVESATRYLSIMVTWVVKGTLNQCMLTARNVKMNGSPHSLEKHSYPTFHVTKLSTA